ncbi:conserved hypothetical protein [Gammaproteobacteria bacterium]
MPTKCIFLMLLALLGMGNLWASDAVVRLGFLVNFARFTEWPESVLRNGAPLQVCLAPGDADMASQLVEVTHQPIHGHSVQARLVKQPDEVRDCNLLYLPAELPDALMSWLSVANRVKALSIGDVPDLTSAGGMIELVLSGGRYYFNINLIAARQADLRISTNLLRLARTVK